MQERQYIPIDSLIAKSFCTPATMIKSEDVDLQECTKVNKGEISNNLVFFSNHGQFE